MNELTIPPAPLWFKNLAIACAPDNTLVYAAKNDIVVLRDKGDTESADVKIIQSAHSKYLTSVSLNKKWKDPNSYVVSSGEEGNLKVWDVDTLEKKFSNKIHADLKHTVIGAVFAGDDKVVSATSDGFIIVWNININETRQLKDLFNGKVNLTCLSSCPHAGWLLAFGLNSGCVVVADLRRDGQVLYRLRGHYQSVVSLAWCPTPINVFPRYVNNIVKNKMPEDSVEEPKTETTKTTRRENPWINLTHTDDDEILSEVTSPDPLVQSTSNFLQECDELRARIMNLDISTIVNGVTEELSSVSNQEDSSIPEPEEKGIEEIRESKLNENRPLPQLYDVSGDFLDDSVDINNVEEIQEEKDVGNEKQEELAEPEVVEEEPRIEYLLASSAKDKSIYIWRAGTDGRMQTFFHSPKRGRNKDSKSANNWITLCWIAPDTLLTSSINGEVLSYTLPKPKETSKHFRVVHREHHNTVFNIVTPSRLISPLNWRDKQDQTFWSWGHEGLLVNYDMKNEKILSSFYTVTASVTCLDSSPLDPNRLAIGIRDGSIRVWDLSLPHYKVITMHRFQQKTIQKVSTIAWHPFKEMMIAFGTEEGRVGFIDTVSKKNTLFPHLFHNQIYKVEWGPIKGDVNNLGLYVVAEGKIVIYDIQRPNDDPISLQMPKQLYVYKFAWKPDFKFLLINGKDGSLVILNTDLVATTTLYLNEKGFNALVWHPDAFTDKPAISTRCNWFAATTSKGLLVYDCTKHTENVPVSENIVAHFEGHLKPTISLAWCPLDGNKIVSIAGDGLTHVWDVASKTAIATFVDSYFSHNCAIIWSPSEADLIITGSEKFIRIWSVSKNPAKINEEFMASRKRLLGKCRVEVEKNQIKINIPPTTKYPKDCIVPSFYVSSDENAAIQIGNMRELMRKKEDKIATESDENKLNPLQIFAEKEAVTQLLTANYEQQKRDGKHKSCEMISLWKGNIGEYIKDVINENRVTPTIITLAPMVSLKLWQDACESYARKLSDNSDSNALEIATYFLACHKIEEAIHCLCDGLMFKEALALAKHRLPDNNEIAVKVTEKWAQHCVNTGNFESSAYCYISLRQYENAAKVLARRNNKDFLEFAGELAEKAGNKELLDSIKFKCDELNKDTLTDAMADLSLPSKADYVLASNSTTEECEESFSETDQCVNGDADDQQ